MKKEENIVQGNGVIRSLINEARLHREKRDIELLLEKKNINEVGSKILLPQEFSLTPIEGDFRKIRESHVKLAHLVLNYDKKIFEQNSQVLNTKKPRSKSVHLYIDEEIETFLNAESQKAETKWKLRKNAGLGCLISKFIGNFIELKKREERQLKRIRKIIDDFRSNLVEFKKNSSDPDDYQRAERSNQRMKLLSNDLMILLSLLEFENDSLKDCLGSDYFNWVDFVIKWKLHS